MKKSLLVTSLFAVIALTACGENKPAEVVAAASEVVSAASDVVASAGAVASEVANLASDVVMQSSEAVASEVMASTPEASK
jgi:hypothetical protein